MQFYEGPSRRVIRRYKSDLAFTIDGIVDQEESRGLFVKQKFQLEQFRDIDSFDTGVNMNNAWVFDYEDDLVVQDFGRAPFLKDHEMDDQLMLNKTFTNVSFIPETCNNFLSIDTKSQARLAPLLCADTTYENVTRAPIVTTDGHGHQPAIFVQLGEYNRFWFGGVEDMGDHGDVMNRTGTAPYTLEHLDDDVKTDEGAGNHAIYTAYGFEPAELPFPQMLREIQENIMVGEYNHQHGYTAGLQDWFYDDKKDIYP